MKKMDLESLSFYMPISQTPCQEIKEKSYRIRGALMLAWFKQKYSHIPVNNSKIPVNAIS